MALNLYENEEGKNAWIARHKQEFGLTRVPFGALVAFVAPSTSAEGKRQAKMEPTATRGIFMGYEVAYGCKVRNYKVLPLSAFDGISLNIKAQAPRLQAGLMTVERITALHEGPGGSKTVGEWVYPSGKGTRNTTAHWKEGQKV